MSLSAYEDWLIRVRAALAEPAPNAVHQAPAGNIGMPASPHRSEALDAAPSAAPEETPSEAVRTAPERIWLQVGDDLNLPFPDNHEDVTWCTGPDQDSDVEYVRADLARRSFALSWSGEPGMSQPPSPAKEGK